MPSKRCAPSTRRSWHWKKPISPRCRRTFRPSSRPPPTASTSPGGWRPSAGTPGSCVRTCSPPSPARTAQTTASTPRTSPAPSSATVPNCKPSSSLPPRGTLLRETFFAYRDARKDQTRAANRIWSFCCRHGLDVDRSITESRCRDLLAETATRDWLRPLASRAAGLVEDWRRAARTVKARQKAIEQEVFADPDMTRLQQVPGIRFIGAFAIVAFAEDIRRFVNPKKFVSYIGLNPTVGDSGEKDGRRSVSRFGRTDLKAIFVEGAQTVLRTGSPMARWAKHLLARGKHWNVVVCALARKLAVLCWHILMGHPAPDRERQPATMRKLDRLARSVGRKAVRAAGYASACEYVSSVATRLYGHLPEPPPKSEILSETA